MKTFRLLLLMLLFCGRQHAINAQTPQDSLDAAAFYAKANTAYKQQSWNEAILLLDSSIAIFQHIQGGFSEGYGDCLFLLGNAEESRKRYGAAVKAFEKCVSVRESVHGSDHWKVAYAHHNWGVSLLRSRQFTPATARFEQSIAILETKIDAHDTLIAHGYNNLSICYREMGKWTENIEMEKIAADLYGRLYGKQHEKVANACKNIGGAYYNTGNFESAREYSEKSAVLYEHLYGIDHVETANIYNNLSMTLLLTGDKNEALAYALKALAIREARQPTSNDYLGESCTNLCAIYNEWGEYELAESYGLKAIGLYEQNLMQFLGAIPLARINLASTYVLTERFDDAIVQYEKAQAILNLGGKNSYPVLISLMNNKSTLYERSGNHPAFLAQIKQSIELVNQTEENTSQKALLQANLGLAYLNIQHLDSAETALLRSLEWANATSNAASINQQTAWLGLARCRHRQGRYQEAVAYLNQAKKANGYQKGQFENVQSLYALLTALTEEASIWADRTDGTREVQLLKALELYAEVCEGADFMWQSSGMDNLTRNTYFRAVYPVYEGYIQTAFALEKIHQDGLNGKRAWEMAERARGHTLREVFQRTRAQEISGVPKAVIEQADKLDASIGYWERQRTLRIVGEQPGPLRAAEDSLLLLRRKEEEFWLGVRNKYPDFWVLSKEAFLVPLKRVQEALDTAECHLGYYMGDTTIYVFVVSSGSLHLKLIPVSFPIERWVNDLHYHLTDYFYTHADSDVLLKEKADAYVAAACGLYDKLVRPVSAWLTDRVTIIPDGILGRIPFDALLSTKPTESTRFNSHAYWGLDKQISYAYSATLQHAMQKRQGPDEEAQPILAMAPFFRGNPDSLYARPLSGDITVKNNSNRQKLSPLPASGQEVKEVSTLFGGKAVYGIAGTRQLFLDEAPLYKMLHLSTHGQANDDVGDNAWIAFAVGEDPTVFDKLYLREVYAMRIKAELVTLSACETGLGRVQQGEGIISFAQAFAFAGAKSIAMTLWKVSDEHTADLMSLFYRKLNEGMEKDRALWEAKKAYISSKKGIDAHPYFWSGFVLVGDMRSLK